MKRQTVMASMIALALLVSPLGNMSDLTQVNAEGQQGAELNSVSGNRQEKVLLDTPANLRWGGDQTNPNNKYCMQWDGVNASVHTSSSGYKSAMWEYQIRRDGGETAISGILNDNAYDQEGTDRSKHVCWRLIDTVGLESGSYSFRVRALAAEGDENYQDSVWSEWSDSIEYIHPGQALDSLTPYWDEQQVGLCHVGPSTKYSPEYLNEHVTVYELTLYKVDGNGGARFCTSAAIHPSKAVSDWDFSDAISQCGAGRYYVTARACSYNIDEIANGEESPGSDILDTAINTETLSGILNGAADKSAVEIAGQLTGSATSSSIQQAMQTSDTFRGQVKELEDRYAAEQGITVESPVVSDAAGKYIDSGRVGMIGAAFNVLQGKNVGLQIDVTAEDNKVLTFMEKSVQLDIRLVSDSAELHDLTMPVSVTMPIPQGIDAARLIILHHRADGAAEQTAFRKNDDGTITFTVAGFSTFVFAEDKSGSVPGPAPVQGTNGSSGQADLESRIAAAAPGATVKVTREQNINVLSRSVMQLLVKRGDVTLEMEYTYEGTDYHVIIPAGMAVDDEIAWYGPLYLSAYYSAANAQTPAVGTADYIVQKGDTLGKIARANGMTVDELAAKNPQIRDRNKIFSGQIIYIK